jgi:hypothetical protein
VTSRKKKYPVELWRINVEPHLAIHKAMFLYRFEEGKKVFEVIVVKIL